MAIIEVVKYNGQPNIFAWKYPSEELGTWTQLIVNESQEAILVKNGQALDVFLPGKYTLDTANIPILNKIINLPFGGRSPFTAEVWYINKTFKLDIKWGTASPIQIQDPKYGIFVPIRSNGMFGIQIEDSRKFLTKLVGTMSVFDDKSVISYFRGLYITKVKDALSSYVVKKGICVLELNAYIDELSAYMKEHVEPEMSNYGIKLAGFYINEISVSENDSAVKKLKAALSKKAEMDIIGYDYRQERSFNTMDSAVRNDSMGMAPFMGAGMGVGMGIGAGGAMAGAVGELAKQVSLDNSQKENRKCPKCQADIPEGQRFCGACGFDTQKSEEDTEEIKEKKTIVCANCGTENKGTKFCTECGKKYIPCPECGADMDEGSSVCKVCGYEIPEKCPNCGSEVRKGIKFCPECGHSLAKTCKKCGAIILGHPKFCPECGEEV